MNESFSDEEVMQHLDESQPSKQYNQMFNEAVVKPRLGSIDSGVPH